MKNRLFRLFVCMLLIMGTVVCAGFASVEVDLLNNGKLIDLNKAIKEYPIGNEGSVSEVLKEVTHEVSVRNKTIKYDGKIIKSANILLVVLKRDCTDNTPVELVDDYAEAHIYKEVLEVMESLSNEGIISYTER